ncbi:MAG: alkaline phosphatase [Vicinamibacterales bacterium]|nr:alkaline phosphatase [Vicinamibacterales bacterium]
MLALGLGAGVPSAAGQTTPRARNVVLFIGDGVDDHQLTIARNYLLGADGEFVFEAFEHRAAAKVQTVLERDPRVPVYVGDSASGGTAIAAGVVTSRGRVATRAGTGEPVSTILEQAAAAGKRTGIVTTSSISDATPASFAAHVRRRWCQGPREMWPTPTDPRCPEDLKANGGLGSIAEQLAGSGIDVLLGGGYRYFDQPDEDGVSVLRRASDAGYRVVRDAAELVETSEVSGKLLGLFGDDTLPVEWVGEAGGRARPLQLTEWGQVIAPQPFGCVANPSFGTRPTLQAMTRAALTRLESAPDGFVLMVESASIDKQAHAGNPCGQIGETRALDEAVRTAVAFQETHPDTLILVSSDHGHSAQIVPWPSLFASRQDAQYPPGKVARLLTLEGGEMAVSYGTNTTYLEEHTGTQVPVYAQGPGAAAVRGLIRQSDLFGIVRRALALE